MVNVYSKPLNTSIKVDRIIDRIINKQAGACLIFFAGIHGNEPSGIFALRNVFKELKENNIPVNANLYAIAGNLSALEKGKRFHESDLNRLWTELQIKKLESGNFEFQNEDEQQQLELFNVYRKILKEHSGPFYFFDLHTTSSETVPFLTVNDSLLNRKFTQQYPVPMVLGIEEYLDGPLLSYLNELGYVSFGFEGGQHDEESAIHNHEAFIKLSLVFADVVSKDSISYEESYQVLKQASKEYQNIYEIYERQAVKYNDEFSMLPGFKNFQSLVKGEHLAYSKGKPIFAKETSKIFMPLYQNSGTDGFFLVREIPKVFLWLSKWFRKLKVDSILPLLPGVNWANQGRDTLIVNTRIAKILAKQFLHLLGYRSKRLDNDRWIIKNRESNSKDQYYRDTYWFQKN